MPLWEAGYTRGLTKYASIAATTAGSPNLIVAGVASKRIVVTHYFITTTVTGTFQFLSNAAAITGASGIVAAAVPTQDHSPDGLFGTGAGEALNLTVTGALAAVDGYIAYVERE